MVHGDTYLNSIGRTRYSNYLTDYWWWSCAGGLSAVGNAIGTQKLRNDPIRSGLTHSRSTVYYIMDAVVEIGRNPVSKHQLMMMIDD